MPYTNTKVLAAVAIVAIALSPATSWACACGCGVFDISTSSMMPTGPGGNVWLEYDYLNQSQNWAGTHRAPKEDNDDRQIRTDLYTAGAQYMFNRSWGAQITVPYWNRNFTSFDDDSATQATYNANSFGDVRLKGIYSGLSDDMSTGITFGVKLPTGSFTTPNFDRDTQIGSGSTDALLGVYHMGALPVGMPFDWFVNGEWSHAVSIQDHYRPGDEMDAAAGIYYEGFDLGKVGKISPLAQIIGSTRRHDGGQNANPDNSGYTRLLVGPGLEYRVGDVKLYSDIETPIYQNVNGDQLVSPISFKFSVGYSF
ncbi:MAG: hypothetical protein JO126_08125 [Alphaproteobacteria bacterium]|nr:hypothetical protein [Alphaproteobacteria bacterium]